MSKYNKILDYIKGLDDSDIVTLWNEYCYTTDRYDDEIMDCYRLEEYAKNTDVMDLLKQFYYGTHERNENSSARPDANYFVFNGYGNIISFDYIYNEYMDEFNHVYIDELIDYIIDNDNDLYNDDIRQILDEEEEI